ncbi:MAG: helix-turn-helix domain-containing protein [Coriobacteriales bacterium]|jgi:flagellar basal body-associated protein FliL
MSRQLVGSALKERREELGISLDMASMATNVRARMLEIIESDDYAQYPPYGHAMGLISSYARYLKLDPRPLLKEFDIAYADYQKSADMAGAADSARRGVGRFGEQTPEGLRPTSRSVHDTGRWHHDEDAGATGDIHEKLNAEQVAEGDDRYKSGSVRLVGTRQTGSFSRVGQTRRARRAELSNRRRDGGASEHRTGADSSSRSGSRAKAVGSRSSIDSSSRSASAGFDQPERAGTSSRASSHRERNISDSKPGTRKRESNEDASPKEKKSAYQEALDTARMHALGKEKSEPPRNDAIDDSAPDFFNVKGTKGADAASRPAAGTGTARRRPRRSGGSSAVRESAPGDSVFSRLITTVQAIFRERRTRLIAIAVILLVIVVIAAAALLISTAGDSSSGLHSVEGGASGTSTTTASNSSASATVTTTDGSPVAVNIDVAEGKTSLISITYDDDNAYNGTAIGPWHRQFLVTSSLVATFGTPDAVTVTQNGNEIEITRESDGTGKLTLNVQSASSTVSSSSSSSSSSDSSSSSSSSSSGD